MFIYIKRIVSTFLSSAIIGKFIAWIFNNKIPYKGMYFLTEDNSVKPNIKSAIAFGFYESAELRFINKYIKGENNLVELGSSLGVLTCILVKKYALSNKKIVAVEANPNLHKIIRQNFNVNNLSQENVYFEQCAVCDIDGEISLFLGNDNTTSTILSSNEPNENINNYVNVPAMRLSSIVKKYNFTSFDLICDIEGAEVDIIFKDPKSLEKCKLIIIEMHETSLYTVEQIVEQILLNGFTLKERYHNVGVFINSIL
jgi:FkbM family methyltransferase